MRLIYLSLILFGLMSCGPQPERMEESIEEGRDASTGSKGGGYNP